MSVNPYPSEPIYQNHPDGFLMPYRRYGREDLEVMYEKYQRLNKYSYGYIVRVGLPQKGH